MDRVLRRPVVLVMPVVWGESRSANFKATDFCRSLENSWGSHGRRPDYLETASVIDRSPDSLPWRPDSSAFWLGREALRRCGHRCGSKGLVVGEKGIATPALARHIDRSTKQKRRDNLRVVIWGGIWGAELAVRWQCAYNVRVMRIVRMHRDFSDFQRGPDAARTCPQDAKTRLRECSGWRNQRSHRGRRSVARADRA
jgi:hypothetical protein